MDEPISKAFTKQFKFTTNKYGKFNESQKVYINPKSRIVEEMQQIKTRLNEVKQKLQDVPFRKWSVHTKRRQLSGHLPRFIAEQRNAEFVTQAWLKLYEILSRFSVIPMDVKQLNSVHLCECPGAFICALNHYLVRRDGAVDWNWLANSLNPFYEGNSMGTTIFDARVVLQTIENWEFGSDYDGDVMSLEYRRDLQKRCQKIGDIRLVTADGSVSCIDSPDIQEDIVLPLIWAEVRCSLHILAEGGSFILKIFTFFESETLQLLYYLNCAFENVEIVKPASSKEGNSEVYVVCTGFKGNSNWEFPNLKLPSGFIEQSIEAAKLFTNFQINAITENIVNFRVVDPMRDEERKWLQNLFCKTFLSQYPIVHLSDSKKLAPISIKYASNQFNDETSEFRNSIQLLSSSVSFTLDNAIDVKYGKAFKELKSSMYADLNIIKRKQYQEIKRPIRTTVQRNRDGVNEFILKVGLLQLDSYLKDQMAACNSITMAVLSMELEDILIIEESLILTGAVAGFIFFLHAMVFFETNLNEDGVIEFRKLQKNGKDNLVKLLRYLNKAYSFDCVLCRVVPTCLTNIGPFYDAVKWFNAKCLIDMQKNSDQNAEM